MLINLVKAHWIKSNIQNHQNTTAQGFIALQQFWSYEHRSILWRGGLLGISFGTQPPSLNTWYNPFPSKPWLFALLMRVLIIWYGYLAMLRYFVAGTTPRWRGALPGSLVSLRLLTHAQRGPFEVFPTRNKGASSSCMLISDWAESHT